MIDQISICLSKTDFTPIACPQKLDVFAVEDEISVEGVPIMKRIEEVLHLDPIDNRLQSSYCPKAFSYPPIKHLWTGC